MKRTLITFFALFLALISLAQAPNTFKYQAVIRDSEGEVIANQAIDLQISIIQGTVGGVSVCTEAFSPTTNAFGLVNLEIGSENPVDFSGIDWSAGPYFVKVEMDASGGGTYVEYGTS